jgi:DNA-binding MarR family transcriptional regulator
VSGWKTDGPGSWADLGPNGERLEIANFPTFHIIRLASLAKHNVTGRYLEEFGLSMPEWRLLSLVATHPPQPFSEVTAKTYMDKGQVSRTLRAVHARGYVSMEQAVGETKRPASGVSPRVIISITPEGLALFNKILPVAQMRQMELIELMSPQERDIFLDILQRMELHLTREGVVR